MKKDRLNFTSISPQFNLGSDFYHIYIYIYLSSRSTFTKQFTLQTNTSAAFDIDFSRDGNWFASGGTDGIVSICDYEELICIRNNLTSQL